MNVSSKGDEHELKAIVRCCLRFGDEVAEQSAMVTLADLQAKHANSAKAKATKQDLQLKRPASKVKVAPIHDNTQPDPGKPNLAAKVARAPQSGGSESHTSGDARISQIGVEPQRDQSDMGTAQNCSCAWRCSS